MKDYTLDDNERSCYILNVRRCRDNTYSIEFADGNVFNNIEVNKENLDKIVRTQEEQAKKAVSNYNKFAEKADRARFGAYTLATGLLFGSCVGSFIPSINNVIINYGGNPIRIASVGAITILGSIPLFTKYNREKSRLIELNKIKYRNQHISELRTFRNYENSLSGVRSDAAKKISHSTNPFSIINIDNFSQDDLENIVSNINIEEDYQFVYKRKTSNK